MITDFKIDENRKAEYYAKGYWTEKTLNDVWSDRAAKYGDREYVSDTDGVRLTYKEIDDKASRLAAWLREKGLQSGDVLSFQIPIWSEFCYVYVAGLKAGAVLHPLPKNFNDEDLAYAMNVVGTKFFICPTFYHKTDYEEQILITKDKVPTLQNIALIDKKAPAHHADIPTLNKIFEQYEPLRDKPASKSDEVACILSTSGTTGRPKQVLFTHNNILFSERVYTEAAERTEKDVMIMQSPLNHATGFFHGLISNMMMGARVVLQDHFAVQEAIDVAKREGVTWSHGATPFVYDLLNRLDATHEPIPDFKIFISGGAPVPSIMVTRAHDHGFLLCESYGSTESCPHVFVPPSKALEWNGEWSGIPYEGIEVRVVDAEHHEVPRGAQGEECSRGPNLFVGYLNNPAANAKTLDADGWFYSGDLCFMDEQGRIRINGRMKEIIIRGGENVSANEVDNNLEGCPGIGDHATIGMPDLRLGERICTFVVPTGDHVPTVKEVSEFLASKDVQKRLWPERIEPIDEIPYTLSGKVKRFELTSEIKNRMAVEFDQKRDEEPKD